MGTCRNLETKIIKNKLTITIDASPEVVAAAPLSGTKRSYVIATSDGFMDVGEFGLNLTLVKRRRD